MSLEYTMQVYNALRASPLTILQDYTLRVFNLPIVNCATVQNLYFAASVNSQKIGIDINNFQAAGFVGGQNNCAAQISMVVSPMRGNGLPVGAAAGARHRAMGILDVANTAANLWVTPTQSGCAVLIVDWGRGRYSMTHLQPSQDAQFNQASRALMGTSDFARNAYKNTWLKQEMTSVVGNTVGAPQRYIMIQSLFEGARGTNTQVIGIRSGAQFTFYRQRDAATLLVEQLQWSTWSAYLPYFSY
jgi:hypothetical protein